MKHKYYDNSNSGTRVFRKLLIKVICKRPSRCAVTNLHNMLYTVNTQQYISTVI